MSQFNQAAAVLSLVATLSSSTALAADNLKSPHSQHPSGLQVEQEETPKKPQKLPPTQPKPFLKHLPPNLLAREIVRMQRKMDAQNRRAGCPANMRPPADPSTGDRCM